MDGKYPQSRISALYMSVDRGSRLFYRHNLAFADDSVVEKVSLRHRVRALLLAGIRGMILASFEVLLSMAWVGLYITETYYKQDPAWITNTNWAFVAIFALLWLVHLLGSNNRLKFLVSIYALIDYITTIPFFFAALGGSNAFFRVIAIFRIFRLLRVLSLAPNDRIRELLRISCVLLCFIFVSSSLILVTEPQTFDTWFKSFYFVIVAIVTVGFGDISPQTDGGKALVICIILCGVVLLPIQAFALARLLSLKIDSINASYVAIHDAKHILILGHAISAPRLSEMITEFSIKYRLQRRVDLHIVVMQPTMPTQELRDLTIPPTDGLSFIHVLRGSALDYKDLKRCSAETAECAVTLYDNDHDSCLVHMALKSYNRSLAIFSLLQRPEKTPLFRAVAPFKENRSEVIPTVLSRMEICAALLARSIPTRGFATLISNLVRTRMVSNTPYEEEHSEYRQGAAYEIYFGVLSNSFHGSNFLDICVSVYAQHNSLLIGLVTDGKHPLLNPGSSYIVKGGELAIFLAPDASVTVLIKDMQYLPISIAQPSTRRKKRKPQTMDAPTQLDPSMAESSTSPILSPNHDTNKTFSEEDTDSEYYVEEVAASTPQSSSKFSRMAWEHEVESQSRLIRYHDVARKGDQLVRYYRVLDSPRTYRSAVVSRAPEAGHIILAGGPSTDWLYYVAPLRSRAISNLQTIVIVTSKPLSNKQWSAIAHFPEVHLMPGASLLRRRDIERLHVTGATHILLTYEQRDYPASTRAAPAAATTALDDGAEAGEDNPSPDVDEDDLSSFDGSLIDDTPKSTRDTILVYSWLTRICPRTRIVMDIREEQDLRFLHKATHALDSHIQQEIRNGSACATMSTVERLLAQTVYNPLVLDVILQLIFGMRNTNLASFAILTRPLKNTAPKQGRLEDDEESSDDEEEELKPIVRLEQIPASLKHSTYRELFDDLVQERDVIPIGLYRSRVRDGKSRKQQYVYTCPPMSTQLEAGDRVYVLLPQVPKS